MFLSTTNGAAVIWRLFPFLGVTRRYSPFPRRSFCSGLVTTITPRSRAAQSKQRGGGAVDRPPRCLLCLLRNYASGCLLWQLLDLRSHDPPEKRHALTADAVTFIAVMISLFAGLAQLGPGQGTHDTVRAKAIGLLEFQHRCISLASKDAVHIAAGIPLGVE